MEAELRRTLIPAALLATLILGACASSGTSPRSTGSPDKLSRSQIVASNVTSAYDVVSQLRPNWLRPPGLTMTGMQSSQNAQVLVYLDGQPMGGPEALKGIATSSVLSMEFLTPTRAAAVVREMSIAKAASSVIMVTTK